MKRNEMKKKKAERNAINLCVVLRIGGVLLSISKYKYVYIHRNGDCISLL